MGKEAKTIYDKTYFRKKFPEGKGIRATYLPIQEEVVQKRQTIILVVGYSRRASHNLRGIDLSKPVYF